MPRRYIAVVIIVGWWLAVVRHIALRCVTLLVIPRHCGALPAFDVVVVVVTLRYPVVGR